MANVLKHRFVSAKANGPDATQVQPSNWNDGHLFTGGNAGDVLVRDPTDASYGATWGTGTGRVRSISNTQVGTVNDWTPAGIVPGANTMIHWSGASNLTVTGFAAGVEGQILTVKNRGSGGAVISFAYDQGSAAGNRLLPAITQALTPVAFDGVIQFIYWANYWIMVGHDQGKWITPAFNAADYSASGGSWAVTSGNVLTCSYHVSVRAVKWALYLTATVVSGAAAVLQRATPGGYTTTGNFSSAGVVYAGGDLFMLATGTGQSLQFSRGFSGAAWPAGTIHLAASGQFEAT